MLYPRWFTCDDLLAMATRDNRCIMVYELSSERLYSPENNRENCLKIGWELAELSKNHKHVNFFIASHCKPVLKENQPRMWDDGKYELVVPGRPTRAQRVSVGRPGTTSKYLPSSHVRGSFSFYYIPYFVLNSPRNQKKLPRKKVNRLSWAHIEPTCAPQRASQRAF